MHIIVQKSDERSEALALFYLSGGPRTRIYRQSLYNPDKGLKIKVFKSRKRAQVLCDEVNKISSQNFKVIPYDGTGHQNVKI